ncbi:ParB/RepB/Spo0J family partition protein (plasmid) [Serratia sp. PAMC26656]|uniref:ParB/RepB/Spo0J family partition protein n=1 Tax=Serratia sp. PAMC26656 TaxID=2775909 RepID=UPI0018F34B9B|nr:ParB/RepB/Spo0J family partition protein [Serratia sp. PAMC26656]MBJ7889446.1 ParB/RepB/Spo0J family partition protein [Serratia sp. PAMC26656]
MAKNFKAHMREKREKTVVPQTTVETPVQERELALPHENLNQQELKVNRTQQEEPAGQVIRVGIDEVYAIEQVRPEEDFEEETIEGMKQTYDGFGILSPPRCFPRDKRGYRIWMGETRWRSAKARGDKYIDIYVGPPPKSDKERIIGQLIENLHQSGLKPLATAIQLQVLRDVHGVTQEAMAKILGKPKTFISKHMRLIEAPASVIALLKDKVTKDVDLAYTLCQINDINPDSVDKLAKLVRDGKLTRQAAIKELNILKDKPPKKEPPVLPTESKTAGTALTGDSNSSETSQLKPEPQSSVSDSGIANGVTPSPAGQTGQPAAGGTDYEARKLKVARVLVKFEDSEGYLVTDKIPDEFGQVWVELPIGTMCIDAADISILGIKVV